jgi:riboflavin synthase
VSGHVDGIGSVSRFEPVGESWELRILAPQALGKYLAYKGSITVNGVSLTVNTCRHGRRLRDQHQPDPAHGRKHRAARLRPAPVNLEIDLIARYVERMLGGRRCPPLPRGTA